MVHSIAIDSVFFLPCLNCTDVWNMANWIYDLHVDAEREPMDIFENVVADGATDDAFDQRERAFPMHEPPPHHSPYIHALPAHIIQFSDHFTGISSGATHVSLDDILSEMRARSAMYAKRDSMIDAMHQQQT